MVGRKPQDPDRKLAVKNIYIPKEIQARIALIGTTITNSAMDVYVQAIRSYFAVYRGEYLAWAKADWQSTGLSWPDYVAKLSEGTLRHDVTVAFAPSALRDIPPVVQGTPMVGINWIMLPKITIFMCHVAARRHGISIVKFVSTVIYWHVQKYWDSNYAPLMVDLADENFIAEAGDWNDYCKD